MPEGAEVRINRDQLAKLLVGRQFATLAPTNGKLKRKGIPGLNDADFGDSVEITEVKVKGKRIVIMLANGDGILSTLGMSGWWYPPKANIDSAVLDSNAYSNGKLVKIEDVVDDAYKHTRCIVVLNINGELTNGAHFCDMRNFGNLSYLTKEKLSVKHPFDELGIDLLNELPEIYKHGFAAGVSKWAEARPKRSKRPIGEILLDQSIACGLGNIYRAEVLYCCGINPLTPTIDLTTLQWDSIGQVSAYIMPMAYNTQGRMEYHAGFLSKWFGYHLRADSLYLGHLVYGRSKDFKGRKIERLNIGGRTMWFCPERQP
jgi:formamidopyrimidine-DNA glycosylase